MTDPSVRSTDRDPITDDAVAPQWDGPPDALDHVARRAKPERAKKFNACTLGCMCIVETPSKGCKCRCHSEPNKETDHA